MKKQRVHKTPAGFQVNQIVDAPPPPSPATHKPPTHGATPWGRIAAQVGFWETAAEQWQQLGKPFKRQECQAAMQALQFALEIL